jgi:4-hydroxy-3-polyprenylbenzoate decarboxylase
MPFEGLREFLSLLETNNELARVSKEVNTSPCEVSAILDRLQKLNGKAVIFETLRNYDIPLCANVLGTLNRVSMALETSENQALEAWTKRKISKWPVPLKVSEGSCKEAIIKQDDIDLNRFPILKWNPLDAAPYVTLGALISKDPETGDRNVGIYRLMVQGKNQFGVNLLEGHHALVHYLKAEAKDQLLEVAVCIGLDPAVLLAAAADLKLGEDELAFAGALRREQVKIVQCETVDLEVPASSEIVFEGIIPPKIRMLEGPFGESKGYYAKAFCRPILKLTAVTHRKDPIYQATYVGKQTKEADNIIFLDKASTNSSTDAFSALRKKLPCLYRESWQKIKSVTSSKRIELPVEAANRVAENWSFYGLD